MLFPVIKLVCYLLAVVIIYTLHLYKMEANKHKHNMLSAAADWLAHVPLGQMAKEPGLRLSNGHSTPFMLLCARSMLLCCVKHCNDSTKRFG